MKKLLLLAVVVHFLVAGWHGASHQMLPVPLSALQTAFVAIVIIALPLVGAALTYSRYLLPGAAIVFASMLASLVFGLVNHFIVVSPDNVWCIPQAPWRASFISSAVVVAASEAFGTCCGAWALWRLMRVQK